MSKPRPLSRFTARMTSALFSRIRSRLASAALMVLTVAISPADAQSPNASMGATLDNVPLVVRPGGTLQIRQIFFATDRKIDLEALAKAKSGGILVGSEDYFLNRFDPMLRYGYVDVSAPPRRSTGDQNFQADSRSQIAIKHFALWSAFLASSAVELKGWMARKYSDRKHSDRPPTMLYVHGIDNSFHDAAERLAQMEIDYLWEGPPLLFSWPSDTFRWFRTVPGLPLTPDNYRKVQRVGSASELYLVQTMRDLLDPGYFHMEAHSMGSQMAARALQFLADSDRLAPPAQGILPQKQMPQPPSTNLILVAPDIATSEFMRMREAILSKVRHITIYCSDDSVLGLSGRVNGDKRLGFCPKERTAAEAVSGVDFVRITGCTPSTWDSHSVHLNVPEVISDIQETLAGRQEMGLPAPGRDREIRCGR